MTPEPHFFSPSELEEFVVRFIADSAPKTAKRLVELAKKTKPSTSVMVSLLEIHADSLGVDQDETTAAWDMAMAVADEGYPGGDADDFDLTAAAVKLISDWKERTEDGDIDPLHGVTSLRIAVGMFVKACHEDEMPDILACGLMALARMTARFGEVTQFDIDTFFQASWRLDEEFTD